MSSRARVLVVEDDLAIRRALESALTAEGYAVRAEADGADVEQVAGSFRPDLAVLDVRLGIGPDGFCVCRRLRRVADLPTLFLTAADALDDRLEGFRVGGDDYLAKPYETRELLARIEALLRRSGGHAGDVLEAGDLVIDTDARTVSLAGTGLELTRTEYELLVALARHAGSVLSKVQLLTTVWGYDLMDTNVVEVHVSSLRRKLEAAGPRLIHTVRGTGYSLRP